MGYISTTISTIALNAALSVSANIACVNFSLPEDGSLPDWLPLLNAGLNKGRDGREFINASSEKIIDWVINVNKKDIQIDIEHSTQLKAPYGDPAPAQGWINASKDSLQVRDGQVWGRVEWNDDGKELLEGKKYRYYSPAFEVDINSQTGELTIIGLVSVGLTNNPNFHIPALNQKHPNQTEETSMDLTELRKFCGLGDSATLDDCMVKLNQMRTDHATALNAATAQPNMSAFAPRTELNTAIGERDALQTQLNQQAQDAKEADITTAISKALADKKISPADKDYYIAQCSKEGGLEEFNQHMEKKAPIVGGASGLEGKDPAKQSKTALNAEEKIVCEQLGLSEEEYLGTKKEGDK